MQNSFFCADKIFPVTIVIQCSIYFQLQKRPFHDTSSNLNKLMDLSGEWINKVHQQQLLKELILDLDSSVSETYRKQTLKRGERNPGIGTGSKKMEKF